MNTDNPQLDTERSLLATLLLRPGDCWGVDIAPGDFAQEAHGRILQQVRDLEAQSLPTDAVSVADAFTAAGEKPLAALTLRIAGDALVTTAPQAFAERVRSAARVRQAHAIAADLARAQGQADIDTAVARLLALDARSVRHEFQAREAVQITVNELQQIADGSAPKQVSTGLHTLDRLIGGFHRGDLIVVGARPAMGKTSLALTMARAAAAADNPVGLISGEQPVQQVATRWLAAASGVPVTDFRSGIEESAWGRVTDAAVTTAALPIWIFDRSAPDLAECIRVARRWKHQHAIRALFVDYLQRVEGPGERRLDQVGGVVRGLKNLARDLDIPVIVLAQVSRQVEMRKPPEPRMGDLSDSSEIEKEADLVMLLYRASQYDPHANPHVAKLTIDKNRHGPTGYIELGFDAPTTRFGDLERLDPYWGAAVA